MDKIIRLRFCIRDSASVVCSASTVAGHEQADASSDSGDCFPSEPSETMLWWMSSNTVYESNDRNKHDDHECQDVSFHEGKSYNSDSAGDLESELIQEHLARGKQELSNRNFECAEQLFWKALSRITSGNVLSPTLFAMRLTILDLLVEVCCVQERWFDAESFLKGKLAFRSRNASEQDISWNFRRKSGPLSSTVHLSPRGGRGRRTGLQVTLSKVL